MRRLPLSLIPVLLGASSLLACSGEVAYEGVQGTLVDRYTPSTGEVKRPNKGAWSTTDALVPSGTSYTRYGGSISDGGDVRVPLVPEGPYLLALTYPPTSAIAGAQPLQVFYGPPTRTVDLGAIYSYRPDIATMTKPTFLELDATLGLPWQTYVNDENGNPVQTLDDDVQFVSHNAGVTGVFSTARAIPDEHPPANGAKELAGWSIDALAGFDYLSSFSLIDGSKGDDFAVLHDVMNQVGMADGNDPWAGSTYTSTQEVLRPAPFTMTDGGKTVLSGKFEPVPQKSITLDYKGSAFNALFSDLGVTSAFVDLSVNREAGSPLPAYGAFALLLDVTASSLTSYEKPDCAGEGCDPTLCPSGCDLGKLVHPGDYTHEFSYGDPFDFGQELLGVNVYFLKTVRTLLPEMTPDSLTGFFSIGARPDELNGKPIVPTLGLPLDIKVAGKATPYDQVTKGVGATPELTWSAPSLGTPTHYLVTVVDLTDLTDKAGTLIRHRNVARFEITGTKLLIPEGVLKAGKYYYFQVAAVARDDDDLGKPFIQSVHDVRSSMFTGVVTP